MRQNDIGGDLIPEPENHDEARHRYRDILAAAGERPRRSHGNGADRKEREAKAVSTWARLPDDGRAGRAHARCTERHCGLCRCGLAGERNATVRRGRGCGSSAG